MSLTFNLSLLFYIIFLQTWKIISPASVYYRDYNNNDITYTGNKDYLDYNQPNSNSKDGERYFNQANNDDINCAAQCTPIMIATTSKPTTTISPTPRPMASDGTAQAEDIVEHIVTVIKSMREHAIALIRNINVLEADLLSSSSSSKLDTICKNSTMPFCDSMEKIVYPDVLYQKPGYEWPISVQSNVLSEEPQTNEFVEQAQEAVKSWKEQIEKCKRMLDNAVHNALLKTNLKNDFMEPMTRKNKKIFKATHYNANDNNGNSKLSAEMKRNKVEIAKGRSQKFANNKKHKYFSIYDALRTKADDY